MKEKRLIGTYTTILSLLVLISLVSIVSAQTYYSGSNSFIQGFQNVFNGVVDFLRVILEPFFGTSTVAGLTPGEVLFVKILFFAIVLALVWSVIDRMVLFGDNTWARVLVSIAVSILGTRILGAPGWIESLMLPYSTLGIAMAAIIPLVIYFVFLEKGFEGDEYIVLRKTAWIFGAVIFISLYILREEQIGAAAGGNFNPAWIYAITAVACLVFFLMDGTIQSMFAKASARNHVSIQKSHATARVTQEISDLREAIFGRNPQYTIAANGKIAGATYKNIYNPLKGRATSLGIFDAMADLPHPA